MPGHHFNLSAYFAAHAPEYDKVYQRPERQKDLRLLKELMTDLLGGRHVLELACGTGYWTQHVADVARSVLAIDSNEEILKFANARLSCFSNAAVMIDDAFSLCNVPDTFDGGLAAFWWSHIPQLQLPAFLDTFHAKLRPGSMIIFADDRLVPGKTSPISRTDDEGDTYQQHRVSDGSVHEILKNFPSRADVEALLRPRARMFTYHEFQYFWCATYQIR